MSYDYIYIPCNFVLKELIITLYVCIYITNLIPKSLLEVKALHYSQKHKRACQFHFSLFSDTLGVLSYLALIWTCCPLCLTQNCHHRVSLQLNPKKFFSSLFYVGSLLFWMPSLSHQWSTHCFNTAHPSVASQERMLVRKRSVF